MSEVKLQQRIALVLTDKTEPKIVLIDIETLPDLQAVMKVIPGLSAYPGLTLKASINSVICFGYKIFGDQKAHCINAWDFPNWDKDVNDDYEICKRAQEIIDTADAVVTHNGKSFDWKFLQTRLMKHGLPPLPKILHIDTKSECKKHLYLFNNRLQTAAQFLTSEEKLENGGWDLWVKVLNRHKPSMKLMTEYCKQDVITLEAVFKKLRPLISNIPNYNLFSPIDADLCPQCGSTRIKKDGIRVTKTAIKQRMRCRDCGSLSHKTKESKPPESY